MKRQPCRSCRSRLELCSMWSLTVTSFVQQVRRRSVFRVAWGVDQKCQKTENNVYLWQCARLGLVYTVKSWNEPISTNTNKLKSSNSLCHRVKPKHLEADSPRNWIMDVWQPRMIDDPAPEVQLSDEEADTRVVLHVWHARRNDSVMHTNTLSLRLMSLTNNLLLAKTWLWKYATWKREEARTFYATRPR